MADPLSTAASVLTILEAIRKAAESGIKIKNAPASWRDYCDELESVGHLQSVLGDILKTANTDRIGDLPLIDVNGNPTNLVDFIAGRLRQVAGQAKDVLGAMYKTKKERKGYFTRFELWIRKSASSIEFFLKEEQIRDLFQAVAHAKSSLQLALTVTQLHLSTTAASAHLDVGTFLQSVKDEMVKQSDFLNRLQTSSQLATSGVSQSLIDKIINRLTRPNTRRKQRQRTRPMLRLASSLPTGGSATWAAVSDHEDDSSSSYEDFPDDARTSTSSGKESQNIQYQPVLNGDYATELVICHVCQRAVTTADDKTEAMVHEDPEHETQFRFFNFGSPGAIDRQMATCWDSKSVQDGWGQDSFLIENQAEAVIFANRRFSMESWTADQRCTFCVLHITAILGRQFFFLSAPCSQDTNCEHVIVECVDIENILSELPMRCMLTFNNLEDWNDPSREPAPGTKSVHLPVYQACLVAGDCLHSLLDSEGHFSAQCAIQSRLCALIRPHFWYEPGTSPPRDVCSYELGNSRGAHSDNSFQGQYRTTQLPAHPAPDDDEGAYILARNSMFNVPAGLPAKINMDTLIKFILLVDKYQLKNGPMEQARKWAGQLLLKPAAVDQEDSITWLWILWKLGMKDEFKTVSGLVQRNAERRIDQAARFYQVTLPRNIIDQLEATRLSALNRIHDLIESQLSSMRIEHLEYLERATRHPDPVDALFYPAHVLINSLLFGYLALAKESWFYPDLARSRTNDFSGVSFSKLATHVRSMIKLEEYMIASVSPGHRLPTWVSVASSLIPVIGVALNAGGVQASIRPPTFRDELENLIEDLESEDVWGIALH